MPRCKNTYFFSVIESFFKKDADNAIQAMINALKAIRLTGKIPKLETKCNARMKTTEKLAVLLLFPFFWCKDASLLLPRGNPRFKEFKKYLQLKGCQSLYFIYLTIFPIIDSTFYAIVKNRFKFDFQHFLVCTMPTLVNGNYLSEVFKSFFIFLAEQFIMV